MYCWYMGQWCSIWFEYFGALVTSTNNTASHSSSPNICLVALVWWPEYTWKFLKVFIDISFITFTIHFSVISLTLLYFHWPAARFLFSTTRFLQCLSYVLSKVRNCKHRSFACSPILFLLSIIFLKLALNPDGLTVPFVLVAFFQTLFPFIFSCMMGMGVCKALYTTFVTGFFWGWIFFFEELYWVFI